MLPALSVFLIPVLTLVFFLHAQSTFDVDARQTLIAQVKEDPTLTPQERQEAIDFYEKVPFSKLLRVPEFAADVDSELRFHYATFRWMIWLSVASIASGVLIFLLAGLCVLLSMHSQEMQYVSLSTGWYVLRIYGAIQTVIQGAMVVALSFWVTALWFDIYIPKMVFLAGVLALFGVGVVIKSIFTKPNMDFEVEGELVDEAKAPALWQNLRNICAQVDTASPDHLIAGIDDNFFVTEQPVTVGDRVYHGRTLYVSLSLLKQLDGAEADAVMAHEMAHFSGNDTTFSKRISPLLIRYHNYLEALSQNPITLPVFYFMVCFRGMYELSLGRLSRQREFRADRIAAETTSARSIVGALTRIAAYSKYRGSIEEDLFNQEEALESADIANRIEDGFHAYAVSFGRNEDIGKLETAHPFDSHPPMHERMAAMGSEYGPQSVDQHLQVPGDGRWFHSIAGCQELERRQWDEYEERFRKFHEEVLAYRLIPSTTAEHELVAKFFPPVSFEGKKGRLAIDYKKLVYEEWPEPILWSEVTDMSLNDNVLHVSVEGTKKNQVLKMGRFAKEQQTDVLEQLNRFYVRQQSVVAYQEEKAVETQADT